MYRNVHLQYCLLSFKIRLVCPTEKAAVTLFQLWVVMYLDWCTGCSRAKAKYKAKHSPSHFFLHKFSDRQVKFSFANKNSLLPGESLFFFFFLEELSYKVRLAKHSSSAISFGPQLSSAYLVQHRLPLDLAHLGADGGRCGLSEVQCGSEGWKVEAAMASHGRS